MGTCFLKQQYTYITVPSHHYYSMNHHIKNFTTKFPITIPYNAHKTDFHSKPCIFLRYNASHKGYLCFHQPTSRIYISRHVVFNEEVFPYILQSTPSHPTTPNLDNTPTIFTRNDSPSSLSTLLPSNQSSLTTSSHLSPL